MLPFRRHSEGPAHIKRRIFSLPTLVSLCLAAALLLFLITRFDVDLGDAWVRVKASNPWYLALAVVVHYTTFLFRGIRWRLLLRNAQAEDSAVPGVLYCSQLVLLGWFVNSVAWFRLGDAYRAYLYRDEQGASFSRTIGTLLAERMLDGFLVVLLLLSTAPFLVNVAPAITWAVLGVALILVVTLVSVFLAITWARELVLRVAVFLVVTLVSVFLAITWAKERGVLRILPGWLAERYQRLQEGVLGSFQQVLPLTIWGLLGWLSEVGRLYLVSQALNLGLGLPLAIFIALANSLLTLVPTPGGIGAVESGVAGLLVRLSSMSTSAAAALVVVDRLITYVSVIMVGGILFLLRQAFPQRMRGNHQPVELTGVDET